MERCLECNSVLTAKEKACPACGLTVGRGKPSLVESLARIARIAIFSAILAVIISQLLPGGSNWIVMLSVFTCTAILLMRKKPQ